MLKIIENPGTISVDDALRSSDLLSQLSEEEISAFGDGLEWCSINADENLFNKRDPGDGLFVLVSGRLEAFDPDAPVDRQVWGRIQPGELVGEMALLSGEPRLASVRALRDSVLLRMTTERFHKLVERVPKILFSLTRILLKRFEATTARRAKAPTHPLIALVPVSRNAPAAELAKRLATEIATLGPVATISKSDAEAALGRPLEEEAAGVSSTTHYQLIRWLQDMETANKAVILVAGNDQSSWTRMCLREADTVVLVAKAGEAPATEGAADQLRQPSAGASDRRELALIHADDTTLPSGTRRWLDTFPVNAHHHVRLGRRGDVRRLSRFLTGRAVALALAGGAGRGFAHIGVLRAFEEANIPVDLVCGTSMGAVVAGMIALGWESSRIQPAAKKFTQLWFIDAGLPIVAMLRGKRWLRQLTEVWGDALVEDLWLNYFAMASSLSAQPVMIKTGPAALAARCSSAVPGLYAPIELDGEFLVDGGLLNNLPAELAQKEARGKTVAVNVLQPPDPKLLQSLLRPQGLLGTLAMLNPFRPQWVLPIVEVGMQGMFLGTYHATGPIRNNVDLYIDPPTSQYGFLDPSAFEAIVQAGYEAARRSLQEWRLRDPDVAAL